MRRASGNGIFASRLRLSPPDQPRENDRDGHMTDEAVEDDDCCREKNYPKVSKGTKKDRFYYFTPATVSKAQMQLQGPPEGYRSGCQDCVRHDMGKNQEKAEHRANLWDFRPASPTIRDNKGHNHGKQETVSRTTMKEIAVTMNNESNEDVYVGQIGEDDDGGENSPEMAVFIGFIAKVMDGQTNCCMS